MEHMETQKFKADMLDQQIKNIEAKLQDVSKLYAVEQQVDDIPVKDKRDFKAKMGLNGTRTIEISSEDYEVVKSLAKSSEGLKTQNKHLLGRVEQVESHLITLRDQNSLLAEQKRRLMDENKQLK